jgi:Protein of unknown function (DUF3303)
MRTPCGAPCNCFQNEATRRHDVHQFVGRLDAEGGFAVVETDNPAELLDSTGKFASFNVFQIYPVVDIDQWAQTLQDGAEFRASIG